MSRRILKKKDNGLQIYSAIDKHFSEAYLKGN